MAPKDKPTWMEHEHALLYDAAYRFMSKEWAPHDLLWREQGAVPRECWHDAGAQGLLCVSVPSEFGGGGGDFKHEVSLILAQGHAKVGGFGGPLHSGVVAHYINVFGSSSQKQKWLPGMASGQLVGAIAMTEPNAGSDLQAMKTKAIRTAGGYRLSGQKTFVTNGQHAGLIIVACKTEQASGAGISLLVVETDRCSGFQRGKNLIKIGQESSDTNELFFDDCCIGEDALLGHVSGGGLMQLMQQLPRERLIIAATALAAMRVALDETIAYVKERCVFGKRIFDFQNSKFVLAECEAAYMATRALVNQGIDQFTAGGLRPDQSALIKYWATEQQFQVINKCLQLFGGYGYMKENIVARLWADSRVQQIYGGTNEIMKEMVARFL